MMDELQAKWEIVRERLHELRGDIEYRAAILPLQLLGMQDGIVKMYAPTRFLYGWVKGAMQIPGYCSASGVRLIVR
jgi:hypothetical protein